MLLFLNKIFEMIIFYTFFFRFNALLFNKMLKAQNFIYELLFKKSQQGLEEISLLKIFESLKHTITSKFYNKIQKPTLIHLSASS